MLDTTAFDEKFEEFPTYLAQLRFPFMVPKKNEPAAIGALFRVNELVV